MSEDMSGSMSEQIYQNKWYTCQPFCQTVSIAVGIILFGSLGIFANRPGLISGAFTNSLCLDSRTDEATAMGSECKGEST
jgi:hypothetical protein